MDGFQTWNIIFVLCEAVKSPNENSRSTDVFLRFSHFHVFSLDWPRRKFLDSTLSLSQMIFYGCGGGGNRRKWPVSRLDPHWRRLVRELVYYKRCRSCLARQSDSLWGNYYTHLTRFDSNLRSFVCERMNPSNWTMHVEFLRHEASTFRQWSSMSVSVRPKRIIFLGASVGASLIIR
jgi:hypothetical protein